MKKLFLIQNPLVFQGEKYVKTNKQYFEGWYFKNTNGKIGVSFIPGININKHEKKAFIQIITSKDSYFVNYDIDDFEFNYDPFYIKIGNNFFSKDKIHIDIKDDIQNLIVYGDIEYSNSTNIDTNFFNPNIMGPFSYIPFMECNHAILSMKSTATGFIDINNQIIFFDDGIGYIEKDWGCSFPESYIWCQGNDFQNPNASFMLSIADIPFKLFHFEGVICVLKINNSEFKFTTYNNSIVIKYDVDENIVNIVFKKGDYYLFMDAECPIGFKLSAPIKGKMEKDILESISASIHITLKKDNEIIFSDTSRNSGLEIVKKQKKLSRL